MNSNPTLNAKAPLQLSGKLNRLRSAAALASAAIFLLSGVFNPVSADDQGHLISGTVRLAENVDEALRKENTSAGIRLIIKLYYPDEGILKDETYRIYNDPVFPLQFDVGPGLDMSRRTKWPAYIIEAYTDLDGNVATLAANELRAISTKLIPTGTKDIEFILQVE